MHCVHTCSDAVAGPCWPLRYPAQLRVSASRALSRLLNAVDVVILLHSCPLAFGNCVSYLLAACLALPRCVARLNVARSTSVRNLFVPT